MRSYSDAQLTRAVQQAHSWRGVLRELELAGTSSGAARSVRNNADRLNLDYSHFRGQRRWSESQLRDAVTSSFSWTEVAARLNLAGGSSNTTLRGHSVRLGLDTSHLDGSAPCGPASSQLRPSIDRLPRVGSLIAASWFELCGCRVSWPLEPSPYDLVAARDRDLHRIQVKTTRHRVGQNWRVKLTSSTRVSRTYDPEEIDDLFVITSDLDLYLIPFTRVAGLAEITLTAYRAYLVPLI